MYVYDAQETNRLSGLYLHVNEDFYLSPLRGGDEQNYKVLQLHVNDAHEG